MLVELACREAVVRFRRRGRGVWLAVLAVILLVSCKRPLKFNEQRLQKKCGVDGRTELTRDQARCMARLAGLRDKKKCPLEIAGIELGESGVPAWIVEEGCGELALTISRADGRVLVVRAGSAEAGSGP